MKRNSQEANPHKGHRENVRRRFMTGGLEVFAPHEILELILFFAIPQKDTNPLAHRLIDTFGSLPRVLSASVEELKAVEGVGERVAVLLTLVFQVGRWTRLRRIEQSVSDFRSPEVLGAYFREIFAGQEKEAVYEMCLNARGNIIVCPRMSNGNVLSVSLDVRAMVEKAILSNCASVVIAHNHPGGDSHPSREDYDATRLIKAAFSDVNIRLLDHIIVGEDDFVSLREIGFLD